MSAQRIRHWFNNRTKTSQVKAAPAHKIRVRDYVASDRKAEVNAMLPAVVAQERAEWVERGGKKRKGEACSEPDMTTCFQIAVTKYLKERSPEETEEMERIVEERNKRAVGLEEWLK